MTSRRLRFTKMQGLGNDFLVVDAAEHGDLPWTSLAPRLCDRRRGVGGDGVLLIGRRDGGLSMQVVNADGGTAEMCGNGVRCAAVWAADRGLGGPTATWETAAGLVTTTLLDASRVRVDMGTPRFAPADVPVRASGAEALDLDLTMPLGSGGAPVRLRGLAVGMGNPHCVVPLEGGDAPWSLEAAPADAVAAWIRGLELFPDGVNVELVEVAAPAHLRQRTVERGVGETDACGTGACAVVAALRRAGRIAAAGPVRVELRGGDLAIDWPGEGPVLMTGPAERVFDGEVALAALDAG